MTGTRIRSAAAHSRLLAAVRPAAGLLRSLRVPFGLVYVVGLSPEIAAFWRIDPATQTLLAAAFTAFGLLGTLAFGFVRALPAEAVGEALVGLEAGRRAFRAALLALAALLVVHGWSEGWPGMRLLGSFRPTELLVRGLFVALAVGAAWVGLVAIWRLDALLGAPAPRRAERGETDPALDTGRS